MDNTEGLMYLSTPEQFRNEVFEWFPAWWTAATPYRATAQDLGDGDGATRLAAMVLLREVAGRLEKRVTHEVRPLAEQFEVSEARLSVLMTLAYSPEAALAPSELGKRLFVSPGNMTGLIDALDRAGLVERKPNPQDRRAQLIALTQKGHEAVASYAPCLHRALRTIGETLTPDEALTFGRLLKKLRDRIG
ncbi:MAG: MarR family winged helix-turn-helix transcriptional regulator [Vulcanimicrobiaceae bacterium]